VDIGMQHSIASDVSAIGRISAVPAILQVIAESTGLRFVAVARVTESDWTACAVLDLLGFGLEVNDTLEIATTLCEEVRGSREPVIIDHASMDERYCTHHTPRLYKFESYISYPVIRADGSFFGTLCALDPLPAKLSEPHIVAMMASFARLLAIQLEAEEGFQRTEAALLLERKNAELREQFIAVLGHDLRNPLFAIDACAEMLMRKPMDERTERLVKHIVSSNQRASQLVEDVLDFARGRLGDGIPVKLRECPNLADSLRHVVAEIQRIHSERVINANIERLEGFRCDPERIGQLLSNLVANAIAHGAQDGTVEVNIGRNVGGFSISVSNQGEPIPACVLERLFLPYSRPLSDLPRAGLGLGLYIASEVARAHGGSLTVTSSREAGTTFTFHQPLQST